MVAATGLYQPFRAIGYVTSDSPVNVQIRGNVHALTASVGNSFHIYSGEKLDLLFTGPQNAEPVTAVAAFKDRIFSASGAGVSIAERGKEVGRFNADTACRIFSLIVFGDLLLALCDDNVVRIWNHTNGEYYNEITFPDTFRVTAALHPSTYLNKILFASQQGSMQLWNIRTLRMLHEFSSLESPITVLTQAPAVDVVAIGLLDGSIVLHNIRADVEIMRLRQQGKVTAISFRTDEKPHMVTGSISGDLAIWDLSKQQVLNVMKGAHSAPVHTACYYAGQPILITAGSDNAIRQWIFDSAEGVPRLLRSRGGHTTPPTRIRYHPLDTSQIISGGVDEAIRVFSVTRDASSMEIPLGEKKGKGFRVDDARIPAIAQFAAAQDATSKAVNIITAHVKDPYARICSYGGKPISKRTFVCTDGALVKSVAISACGHFGFVGSALGRLDRYNLQSGLLRKTYGDQHGGHTKAIVGIVSDRVNRLVITAGLDGLVKFWSFKSGSLLHTINVPAPISAVDLHRESGLLSVVSDDFVIRVIDTSTHKVVREFMGHRSQITDTTFTPDGRLIISTSTDSTLRTWDLPTGHCVDITRVTSVPRSVSISPNGDYVATVHADQVGIFLWANRMQFGGVLIKRVDEEAAAAAPVTELPQTGGMVLTEEDENAAAELADQVRRQELLEEQEIERGARVVDDELISFSGVAKTKWQNLLSLDALRKRNQPAEAPKTDRASFFLPTLREQKMQFEADAAAAAASTDSKPQSRILHSAIDVSSTTDNLFTSQQNMEFSRLLRECHAEEDFDELMTYLRDMAPSQIDVTLRTLDRETELDLFVDAVVWMLDRRRDFEAVEAFIAVLVKIHSSELLTNPKLDELLKRHTQNWEVLENMFQYGLCLLDFVKK
ncbi:WD40-repeat-containing domain protein [Powellomyces hirtus]|nr:WD40-repeat-containing domain protein [Powellomyces hirtus]